MLLYDHEQKIKKILTKAGVDNPGLCAHILIMVCANLDRNSYYLNSHKYLSPQECEILYKLTERRAKGEPLAYILGKKGFYDHDFIVSNATLIPRPETELIIDLTLEIYQNDPITFADLGCGCGCIGLSLLARRKNWQGFLIDISCDALNIARLNKNKIAPQAHLVNADICNLPFKPSSISLIVSNPPYIDINDSDHVMRETLEFEPHLALFSSNNGLFHIEQVGIQAFTVLKPGGRLILEHGATQAKQVKKILAAIGFQKIEVFKDLANLPRCCMAIKKEL